MGFSYMISIMSEKKEKVSLKNTIKRSIQALFRKKNKHKHEQNAAEKESKSIEAKENTDDTKKLNDEASCTNKLNDEVSCAPKTDASNKHVKQRETNDELALFETVVIKDERQNLSELEEAALSTVKRSGSESSTDSGVVADVTDDIANLTIEDDAHKSDISKKVKKIFAVSRGIERTKKKISVAPYPGKVIATVNTNNDSGGSVYSNYQLPEVQDVRSLVEEAEEIMSQHIANCRFKDQQKLRQSEPTNSSDEISRSFYEDPTVVEDLCMDLLNEDLAFVNQSVSTYDVGTNQLAVGNYPRQFGGPTSSISNGYTSFDMSSVESENYQSNALPYLEQQYINNNPSISAFAPNASLSTNGQMIEDNSFIYATPSLPNADTIPGAYALTEVGSSYSETVPVESDLDNQDWLNRFSLTPPHCPEAQLPSHLPPSFSSAHSDTNPPASTSKTGLENSYLTPPYADDENQLSLYALSCSPSSSFNAQTPSNPTLSPLHDSENESYQNISPSAPELENSEVKTKITLKQLKKRQSELDDKFRKHFCCSDNSLEICRKFFSAHLEKLNASERKHLCLKTATRDLDVAEKIILQAMFDLSKPFVDQPSTCFAVIFLMCEKVLGMQKRWYIESFGLEILKAAVFLCYKHPMVAKYITFNIRTAVRELKREGCTNIPSPLFNERDARGDSAVIGCARAGDSHAAALSALCDVTDPPLFNVHLENNEGRNALHEACLHHSANAPRLQNVHILLNHAGMSVTKGDIKGGDTPIHYAVNSSSCDLDLVLTLFHSQNQSEWFTLSTMKNKSQQTPRRLALTASKCQARKYPQEVLEFLSKCRKAEPKKNQPSMDQA